MNWGAVLGRTDNGSLQFRTPNRGTTMDLYTFPSDPNNPAAYKASGTLSVGRNSAWEREQISGVTSYEGDNVDINWGQHIWNHAFNELNRVLSNPYTIDSVRSTGGSNLYGFRNEGGMGGKGTGYIYVDPKVASNDLSRKRTAIEELAETIGGYNNLNGVPSQSTLCDSQDDTINESGQKVTRLIHLMSN